MKKGVSKFLLLEFIFYFKKIVGLPFSVIVRLIVYVTILQYGCLISFLCFGRLYVTILQYGYFVSGIFVMYVLYTFFKHASSLGTYSMLSISQAASWLYGIVLVLRRA